MSLIKKPSQLEINPALSALIYAQPGTGKTTLACSAPNAVLFDFDGGVNRINGAHQVPTVQVHTWEEAMQAFAEVKASPEYQSIVIDTVGKMLAFMEEYIKRTDPKKRKADGSLSLQGYGVRKQMFINFIKEAATMGKHVIFVAHEIEQKRNEETIIRPEVGGSSASDLLKELDLVGYMEMSGKIRTISFDPCEKFYAKNSCDMQGVIQIPLLIDDNGNPVGENNFLVNVIKNYHNRLKKNKEQTAKYEAFVEEIKAKISGIANAEDANNFVQWVKDVEHIYNSKAVALTQLLKRAKELGLTYNKATEKYA